MAFGVVLSFCSRTISPVSFNTQYQLERSPRAAVLLFGMCFVISWWVEAAYVKWWIGRKKADPELVNSQTSRVVRNSNVLSYLLVAAISIGVLALL
jgi:hypothetical protein